MEGREEDGGRRTCTISSERRHGRERQGTDGDTDGFNFNSATRRATERTKDLTNTINSSSQTDDMGGRTNTHQGGGTEDGFNSVTWRTGERTTALHNINRTETGEGRKGDGWTDTDGFNN